ncbi:dTDP-4-dehydrorhamnose reductase [Pontibacter sp. H249]|uniref:dTDP-4-dehydrorhamnose reductase n=1 Tax=Pontibacter sp. H249 TaxID=3133420 RepID=UPI0030BF006A
MSKIIVFGASGQLGQCLQSVSTEKSITDICYLPEEEANILDQEALQKVFETHKPQYCINCAAYTAVDKAEDEKELADKINVEGVANLSKLCQEFGTTLIHISTDFVFAGNTNQPLKEEDETAPINVYGATKLAGEQVIPSFISNYFIIRTSWLYSEFGNNFVKTMLRLGEERDELKVIWDQVGTPTYAVDLAECIFNLIQTDNQQYGTYHYSNEGMTTWYDFAQAIFDIRNIKVKAHPVRTSEYITKAVRPSFSVMDKTKMKQNFNINIPHWRDSLVKCLNRL